MPDTVPLGGERARPYSPEMERLFLRPYTVGQMPQELLAAVLRVVERFQSLDRPR